MRILNATPKPYEKSILPAISFEVDIAHTAFQEAIVSVDGWLESDDDKILADITEIGTDRNFSEVGARGSSHDNEFKETIYHSTLVASLDRKALSYLEDRRMQNEKRDVFLNLMLIIRTIVSKTSISHLHEIDSQDFGLGKKFEVNTSSGKQEGKIMAYAYDPSFRSSNIDHWILSGNGSPFFLSVERHTIDKKEIRINAVDWIHDYAPKFELGRYFIVEIPKGKEIVKKAWDYVNSAEECYRQWNTKGAYANCREVGELLDKTVNKKFQNDPAIKKWKRAIEKFNKLTSTDLHEEDIMEEEPKGKISIGRPEIEYVLIVTKALIKYAEELLQEK
jgi:hypothetical protein